jgi:hypothetical protein
MTPFCLVMVVVTWAQTGCGLEVPCQPHCLAHKTFALVAVAPFSCKEFSVSCGVFAGLSTWMSVCVKHAPLWTPWPLD